MCIYIYIVLSITSDHHWPKIPPNDPMTQILLHVKTTHAYTSVTHVANNDCSYSQFYYALNTNRYKPCLQQVNNRLIRSFFILIIIRAIIF